MSLLDLGAVTVAAYQIHTGDTTTAASAVTGALVEAETLLDEELRRHLALDERVDAFRIYPDSRVYPDAWPITVAPLFIDGRSLFGASPDTGPFVGVVEQPYPYRATITWTGGYDDGTSSDPLPLTLAHAIYELAHALASGSPASGSPASVLVGATSAQVGDVQVTYASPGSGSVDALVPGLSSRVDRYRNRYV